jgi:hypothetical protein
MKGRAEMHEGREAFSRFRDAIKQILSVPKNSLPVRTKRKTKKKSRQPTKG